MLKVFKDRVVWVIMEDHQFDSWQFMFTIIIIIFLRKEQNYWITQEDRKKMSCREILMMIYWFILIIYIWRAIIGAVADIDIHGHSFFIHIYTHIYTKILLRCLSDFIKIYQDFIILWHIYTLDFRIHHLFTQGYILIIYKRNYIWIYTSNL